MHLPVCALLQEQGLLLASSGEHVQSNSSSDSKLSEFKGCRVKCPGVTCQFVCYSKNKDFSLLQLVIVLGLMVPVLLLGARVQGMQGQMPWCHLLVCALVQEQGLLLVSVFRLSVHVLLLGVRVQGVSGKMPWRHLPVCVLLQEQGLLLAPTGERVWFNDSCLAPRCRSSRGAG
jgi:hypothetical protein